MDLRAFRRRDCEGVREGSIRGNSSPTLCTTSGPPPTIQQVTQSLTRRWACSPLGLRGFIYSVLRQFVYTSVDMYCHNASLVGRLILQLPSWQ